MTLGGGGDVWRWHDGAWRGSAAEREEAARWITGERDRGSVERRGKEWGRGDRVSRLTKSSSSAGSAPELLLTCQ